MQAHSSFGKVLAYENKDTNLAQNKTKHTET